LRQLFFAELIEEFLTGLKPGKFTGCRARQRVPRNKAYQTVQTELFKKYGSQTLYESVRLDIGLAPLNHDYRLSPPIRTRHREGCGVSGLYFGCIWARYSSPGADIAALMMIRSFSRP
jgi:hypothetical protein